MFDRPGLWGHADFKRLWAAQTISAFGSRITRTALPIIAVATLGESELIVGLLASLSLAPGAVLAFFAGGLVDRGHKRRILIIADVIRAIAVASLTVAWGFGALRIGQVLAVAALVGAASTLFHIANVAYLPSLIGRDQLAEGNAKLESTEAIAEVSGPASAGVLIAALGAPLAVAIDAVSYVWSAWMLRQIRAVEPAPQAHVSSELASASMWQSTMDLRVGMRAVFGNRHVRPIVIGLMVFWTSYGFFAALYTLFCLRTLALSQATFGVVVAFGGVGSIIGALITRPIARMIGIGPTLILAATISALAGLMIPLASGPRWLALGFLGAHQLIGDGFGVVFNVNQVTLRQTALPAAQLGRANAAIHICTEGIVPFAALAAGTLAALTSIRCATWIGMAIALAAPLCLLPLRKLKTLDSFHSEGAMSVGRDMAI